MRGLGPRVPTEESLLLAEGPWWLRWCQEGCTWGHLPALGLEGCER